VYGKSSVSLISRGKLEVVEEHVEAMGSGVNMYAFDGGGIIKSRIKVIHEGPIYSCLQSLLIFGWAVAG